MALPTIACKECGHTNEGERLFCHECGSKLDRAGVVAHQHEKEKKAGSPEQVQERVRRVMRPESRFMHGFFKSAGRTLSLSALTALLAAALLPPRNLPEAKADDVYSDAPRAALEMAAISRMPFERQITQEEINSYLKSSVRLKTTGPLENILKFDRVFTILEEGSLRVVLQKSVSGLPIYAGAAFGLKAGGSELEVTPQGMNIGRLNLPASVLGYAKGIFDPVWDSLKTERERMNAIGGVEIRKGALILRSKAAVAAPAPSVAPAPAPAP